MNILIPDSWLREYLKTDASPEQLMEYLSLSGPSVERVSYETGEPVYDIEITSNRPDSMSVSGIAREAAAILPRFGVEATFVNDPYRINTKKALLPYKIKRAEMPISITTDPILNPRWTSVVIRSVTVAPSPKWLAQKLENTGIRPLNNVIDITNYLMRAFGQPAHAFDYDQIKPKKGKPAMTLRASRKGERIKTLDGKTHTLAGGDIVIEDGSGRLIDLCGIMGAENSSIRENTTTIVLFLQTYNPSQIRRTSMSLSHRTEASGLFEKGIDSELVLPALVRGIELMTELTGGTVASRIHDSNPNPYKQTVVSVTRKKLSSYLGMTIPDAEMTAMLGSLGFIVRLTKEDISVSVPSYRRDITIDVDIIEEVARLYGYQAIAARLPESEPPLPKPDDTLETENEIKLRMRDWGYTEILTYSMISESEMDLFGLPKQMAYRITNPLSSEWEFLRPSLLPSILSAIRQNLAYTQSLALFELSQTYHYRDNDLPAEEPTLVVAASGSVFRQLKGLAEALLGAYRIETSWQIPSENDPDAAHLSPFCAVIPGLASVGVLSEKLRVACKIKLPVTILTISVSELVRRRKTGSTYQPIPKYPPSFEDIALVVPPKTYVGKLMDMFRQADPLISDVELLDSHGDTRTFHVTFQSKEKNLTGDDVRSVREKLLDMAFRQFRAKLKSTGQE